MITEAHKGNEAKNLPRIKAVFPINRFLERLIFAPSTNISSSPAKNPSFPSLALVHLAFLRFRPVAPSHRFTPRNRPGIGT